MARLNRYSWQLAHLEALSILNKQRSTLKLQPALLEQATLILAFALRAPPPILPVDFSSFFQLENVFKPVRRKL